MKHVVRYIAGLLAIGWVASAAGATYPKVSAEIAPTRALVGDQVVMKLSITAPDLTKMTIKESFSQDRETTWALVDKRVAPDVQLNATERRRDVTYLIAPLRPGKLDPPLLEINYQPAQGAPRTVVADAASVTVESVLPVDTKEAGLKDVKPPVKLPFPRYVIVLASVVGGLLLAWLIYALVRKYRGRLRDVISPPKRLDEWALAEISALENGKLIEQKKVNELYTRLTDVMRTYVGKLYNIRAHDMTSYELLLTLEEAMHSPQTHDVMEHLLDEADLVKFARHVPEAHECRRSLERARQIVHETRHLLEPKPDAAEAAKTDSTPPPPPAAPPPAPPPPPPVPPVRTEGEAA